MASSTVENYLKQLYLQQWSSGEPQAVPTGKLATVMGVVPGTATSMIKALADSGLVRYEARTGVRLTPSGEQLALHVVRRHRLIELFLVKVLGLDWSMVHDEAEALEHAVSDRVIERIDAMLGHPSVDPHGDPIPTAAGHEETPHRLTLADCPVNRPQRVSRIIDQDPEFLRFVEQHRLTPSATLAVTSRESASGVVQVEVNRKHTVSLGLDVAAKIVVEPLPASSSVRRGK